VNSAKSSIFDVTHPATGGTQGTPGSLYSLDHTNRTTRRNGHKSGQIST
jgi:hypothetical protein